MTYSLDCGLSYFEGTCRCLGEAPAGFGWENLRERDHWGDPRRRWEDNNKMDLQELEWGDVDWIGLAQDRDSWRALVNVVMNLRVP
jgi:hypothetical protein